MHLQNLLRPAAHPRAERLDGGSVYTPFGHSELPEVGSRVTGQGLAVLKEEAAQLTAGILEAARKEENGLLPLKSKMIDFTSKKNLEQLTPVAVLIWGGFPFEGEIVWLR